MTFPKSGARLKLKKIKMLFLNAKYKNLSLKNYQDVLILANILKVLLLKRGFILTCGCFSYKN